MSNLIKNEASCHRTVMLYQQEGGNRVFDGLVDDSVQGVGEFDGDESATFRDADGSVTRCPSETNWEGPVQIVKPEVTAVTERCAYVKTGIWLYAAIYTER